MLNKYPQRVAWITLISCFIIFCLICASTFWLTRWFLFESSTTLNATLYVSRGTVSVTSPDDVNDRAITTNSEIRVGETIHGSDEIAQGSLRFTDPADPAKVLATIQFMPGSQARLRQSSRPRFGIGNPPFVIHLSDASGEITVNISPQIDRDIRIEIDHAEWAVRLDQGGYYLLNISDQRFQVTVRQGQAILINALQETQLVNPNQTFFINSRNAFSDRIQPVYNIIPNDLFTEGNDFPEAWGCSRENVKPGESAGEYNWEFFQDRYVMHLHREDVGPSGVHCEQRDLNVDVSGYDSLKFRASMYLVSHSLSACGSAGSECVLMLRVVYRNQSDVNNNDTQTEREWIQGFYITYDPNRGGEKRCVSCASANAHIQVSGNTWYTFETGDLVRDLIDAEETLRPAQILRIEFYSSGHAYDAYISEFSVVGEELPDPAQ